MIAIASAVIAPCMIAVIAVAKRCDSALFFSRDWSCSCQGPRQHWIRQ